MKVGKIFKECEKKNLDVITESRYEVLCEIARERGLKEITDDLVIAEIKYCFEEAPHCSDYELIFEADTYMRKVYADDYKRQKKEYNTLKQMYKKYAV